MKRFISKVQNLSQKAAEIKAAMQQVPPKVAEIREAVAATTGQLQQLKSEIHYSVADLKADNEDRLSEAMQEINASAEVFAQAGFILSGVDLEISPVQRMLVHLTKVESVHASMLRSLVSANQHRRTTHAILSSLLQANQMADTVEFSDLVYDEVVVGIGPIPSIRVCWRAEEDEQTTVGQTAPAISVAPPLAASAPAAQPPPQSVFGTSSFFERREVASTPSAVPSVTPTVSTAPIDEPSPVAKAPLLTEPAGSVDPLARFKRMPVLHR
jgi:hypothetical protein